MHESPVKGFYRMFFYVRFLLKENVIVSKDCIEKYKNWISKEDKDDEETVAYSPVDIVILPMKFKATYFLPKEVLVVRVTNKQFVVVA